MCGHEPGGPLNTQTWLLPPPRRLAPPGAPPPARGTPQQVAEIAGSGLGRRRSLGGVKRRRWNPPARHATVLRRRARPLLERGVPARHVLARRIDRRLGELGELDRREDRAVGDRRALAGDERQRADRRV